MSLISYVQRGVKAIASLRVLSFSSFPIHASELRTDHSANSLTDYETPLAFQYDHQMPKYDGFDYLKAEKSISYQKDVMPGPFERLESVFPDRPANRGDIFPMMFLLHTVNDMSIWSYDSQKERENETKIFIGIAKEFCAELKTLGYWSNFVDPSSGMPYEGSYTNEPLTDCDEDFTSFSEDLELEDIGCCRALKHCKWGFNVFSGLIVCNAPEVVALKTFKLSEHKFFAN